MRGGGRLEIALLALYVFESIIKEALRDVSTSFSRS
jgi:hypothetical protein